MFDSLSNKGIIQFNQSHKVDHLTVASLSGLRIKGKGHSLISNLTALGNSKRVLYFTDCPDLVIDDLVIDGGRGEVITSPGDEAGEAVSGIRFENCDNLLINNLTVKNYLSPANAGVDGEDPCGAYFLNCDGVKLLNSRARYIAKEGLLFNTCTDVHIDNFDWYMIGWTILHLGPWCSNVTLDHSQSYKSGQNSAAGSLITVGVTGTKILNSKFYWHGSDFTGDITSSTHWGAGPVNVHSVARRHRVVRHHHR